MLRRRTSPTIVTLLNGTTFTARYKRISRKQLPTNIHVTNARKIGPRNRNKSKMGPGPTKSAKVTKKKKKKVRFSPSTSLRERLARIKRYRDSRKRQTRSGLASDSSKISLTMRSKALNSTVGRKIINKGIDNILNMFKYGVSKIKNKNLKRALNSDIPNIKAQNKVRKTSGSLFD